ADQQHAEVTVDQLVPFQNPSRTAGSCGKLPLADNRDVGAVRLVEKIVLAIAQTAQDHVTASRREDPVQIAW
ncbi:hypothetical protein, partial [Sphingomonas azotifigens]|uniref:hypothetical protein n=1 Tax=Sphingomonas azotifigens TaxID=330920 RepID=UPI001C3F75EF